MPLCLLRSFPQRGAFYIIAEVHSELPSTMFRLKDTRGKMLTGLYYAPQLNHVPAPLKNHVYPISHVIKERTVKGKKEYYVRWLGYPSR